MFMHLKPIGFTAPVVLSRLIGHLMLRRALLAGLSFCALSLILSYGSIYAQGLPPAGGGKPAQPPTPVTLLPSKLDLCQFGFAYAHLKVETRKLKVKHNSDPNVVRAKDGPNGNFIILIAGKNFGDSDVTFTGEMEQGNKWVSFIQKLTVSVVACKQPKPPGQGGGGVEPGAKAFSLQKAICNGESYYYTLHVRAPDGSNSLIHVSTISSSPVVASATYDNASATVSGVGLSPGEATITVTGEVEAIDEDIPFTMTIVVTVLDCKSVEVCKGASVKVAIENAAGATSTDATVAVPGMVGNDVEVTGRIVGSTLISVTGAGGKQVGRIKVAVKNCPPRDDKTDVIPPQLPDSGFDILVHCTDTGQICDQKYEVQVEAGNKPGMRFTVGPQHCSSVRLYVSLDGKRVYASGFLAAGQDTGQIALSAAPGRHTLTLEAEGSYGGCNTGTLESWAGRVSLTSVTVLEGGSK
jgi:hypothetical protein